MSELSQEYSDKIKNSITLPKTDFPMRGKLPHTEPARIKYWNDNKIYEKMLQKNKDNKNFTMPDGPPYANGNIHVGHVLNKVLKDIVIKYKSMTGHYSPLIPGWDCHGLPIELIVTKKLGSKRRDMTDKKVRELCRAEANKWVGIQKEQFIRLGILADWENPYLTIQPEYEADEIRVLAKILENGHLYKGEKPVNWCPKLQTALASAEVEYADHNSPSVYVKFEANVGKEKFGLEEPVSFVIWTTTPWTLPANFGICLNEKFEYGIYKSEKGNLIIAKELSEKVAKECELTLTLIKDFKGDFFKDMSADHPFIDRQSKIVFGHHVTLEAGTGCVHTAPGHGLDDYMVGLKYDLPVFSPVGPGGKFSDDVEKYAGMKIWDANPVIVEDMKQAGSLIGFKMISHSYPHNPRTKSPLIFRSTPQWFIKMDGEGKLRQDALKACAEDISFIPSWGSTRLNAMIENTPDWCLSRQRTWGVPVPVFNCKSCGHSILDAKIMNAIADKMESTGEGLEAYYSSSPKDFIGDAKCSECGHTEFEHSKDILDVWFDSGVLHTSVQKRRKELTFPADIYLEGSDQHRGWFQTSLMSSIAAYKTPPYKKLITHGFVTDAKGHKMSKSKGNVIDPDKINKQYGAEILRLWVAYEDYGQDITVSDEMFKRISETYRRIRNTIKFLLGNLNDFDPNKNLVDYGKLSDLDKWALAKLNQLTEQTTEAYESYNLYKVYHGLNNFFTVDLSSFYLDILKDRLYTSKADGLARRSSQTVIFHLLDNLTKIMAPIITFIAEETYEYMPNKNTDSILLTDFPVKNNKWKNSEIIESFEVLIELRSKVTKVLEELRANKTIGSSLEAHLDLSLNGSEYKISKNYESFLPELFIVSEVALIEGEFKVSAKKATGTKCIRCWNYNKNTGLDDKWPEVCPKCVEALT